MMKYKIMGITLSLFLIISQLLSNSVYAQCFEDEEDDNNIAILEDNEIDDVDMNNIINSIRVSARNAIALDSKTKQVLFEQNADEIVPMASTTKILTALVAITHGDLEREVTISRNAASIRGSKVGYVAGEVQSATTILGMRVIMIWIPIVCAIVMYTIYKSKYKINGKFHDDMLVELEKRKKANDAI